MAPAQVVETSVNTNNSPQGYTTNPDDHSNHNINQVIYKKARSWLCAFMIEGFFASYKLKYIRHCSILYMYVIVQIPKMVYDGLF